MTAGSAVQPIPSTPYFDAGSESTIAVGAQPKLDYLDASQVK